MITKFVKGLGTAVAVIGGTILVVGISLVTYFFGYLSGYNNGAAEVSNYYQATLAEVETSSTQEPSISPKPSQQQVAKTPSTTVSNYNWSGPELWDAVNKRRVKNGVNSLSSKSELCTIASIRLNELLELGKLDGHAGFSKLAEDREDLKWIFDKYNISEFLVSGATSAENAVDLWQNTLGHKILLTGGEYVWGCTYAQNGFGVAIAAY